MKRLILVMLMSGMFVGQTFPIACNELLSQVANNAAPVAKEAFNGAKNTLMAIGGVTLVFGAFLAACRNTDTDELEQVSVCEGIKRSLMSAAVFGTITSPILGGGESRAARLGGLAVAGSLLGVIHKYYGLHNILN